MMDNQILISLLPVAFLFGACVGSFVTMASYRLPRDEEIVLKPSHCPHCEAKLTARDLVPVLSWAMQRGHCRHCKARVGIRYPLTEIALGLAFAGLYVVYGLTFHAAILMLLATGLAVLIITDLEHTIIPDSVQIYLLFTGVAYAVWMNAEWEDVGLSAGFGLMLGLLLHYGYKWLRHKDGLGLADVKFFCVAGVWLPFASFVSFMFFAGVFGTITGILWNRYKEKGIFPFGPALALSLFINVLFPDLLQRLV